MRISINKGDNIKDALQKAGLIFTCGGNGICGKCRIKATGLELPPSETEKHLLTAAELEQGYRLACSLNYAADKELEAEFVQEPAVWSKSKSEAANAAGNENGPATAIRAGFKIAIDIGTTTLAIALVGQGIPENAAITMLNPQRSFGADVVSRIVAANNGHLQEMRGMVIDAIDNGINQLFEKYGLRPEELVDIAVTGNTAMEHIFRGDSLAGLGTAPFTPVTVKTVRTPSGLVLPGISAYVGADTVSGMLALGFGNDSNGLKLLIDLGTNGEIALGNSERIIVASTAAGPAFEGGNISCGTAAVTGAVYDVELNDEEGSEPIILHKIGSSDSISNINGGNVSLEGVESVNKNCPGICGSGVIALVYELLKEGLIDETGLLDERLKGKIRLDESGRLTFTQRDLRELQLAKAAVRAGIETLVFAFGAAYEDIEEVYIAGSFGKGLNIAKAAGIGIIPSELEAVAKPVGNTALKGAAEYLRNPESSAAGMDAIVRVSHEIVLAGNDYFAARFLQHMNFERSPRS